MRKTGIIQMSLLLGLWLGLMGSQAWGGENMKMSYRLEGAYMPYKYVQIELSGSGSGKLTYCLYRKNTAAATEKEKTVVFRLDKARVKELANLYAKVDFLHLQINDLNKDEVRVTDVGRTTLAYSRAGKKRELSYGYVEDNPLQELVGLYGKLAQEYLPKP